MDQPMTQEQLNVAAENRWTTVRHLVWQGWQENVDDSWKGVLADSGRIYVDEEGGLWSEAHPEVCAELGKHMPRWHPAEFGGHYYCVMCGEQGVPGGV